MPRFRRDAAFPCVLGSAVVGRVPASLADGVAAAVSIAAASRDRDRRVMIERHLRRVLGPDVPQRRVDAMVLRAFASYARYWVEALRLPGMTFDEVDAGMSWEGLGRIDDALAAGRGAIVAIPHLGAWDYAGAWLGMIGYPLTVVVEPLEPPEVFEWFAGYRRSLGMTVVPLGPDAGHAVLRALKANQIVCLLSDRDVAGGGVEVDFFGERTTVPAGPVTLALRTGAPVFPTAVYYDDDRGGHAGVVRPALKLERRGRLREDVAAGTQLLVSELELLIRHAPEQWHLFQPNWPSDHQLFL